MTPEATALVSILLVLTAGPATAWLIARWPPKRSGFPGVQPSKPWPMANAPVPVRKAASSMDGVVVGVAEHDYEAGDMMVLRPTPDGFRVINPCAVCGKPEGTDAARQLGWNTDKMCWGHDVEGHPV